MTTLSLDTIIVRDDFRERQASLCDKIILHEKRIYSFVLNSSRDPVSSSTIIRSLKTDGLWPKIVPHADGESSGQKLSRVLRGEIIPSGVGPCS